MTWQEIACEKVHTSWDSAERFLAVLKTQSPGTDSKNYEIPLPTKTMWVVAKSYYEALGLALVVNGWFPWPSKRPSAVLNTFVNQNL